MENGLQWWRTNTWLGESQKNVQSAAESAQKQSAASNLMETNVQIAEKKENKTKCNGIKNRWTHQKEICFLHPSPLPETILAV